MTASKVIADYGSVSMVLTDYAGRGVVANQDFAIGDTIHIAPALVFGGKSDRHLMNTQLAEYVFHWPYDKDGNYTENELACQTAVAMGLGAIFNHSPEPNCDWDCILEHNLIKYRAIKPIAKGDEITIYYGNGEFN